MGGRFSPELTVWDVQTRQQMPTITTPARRIESKLVAFTTDGQYFSSMVNDRLVVVQTKTARTAAVMESPRPQSDGTEPMNDVQRMISARRVLSDIREIGFSHDGQELAAVADSRTPRLICWSSRGKVTFDRLIPRVQHVLFFRSRFDWLPDASGWVVCGHVFERNSQRCVLAIRTPFAQTPLYYPVDRDHLVGIFPREPNVLQMLPIPWKEIEASQALLEQGAPAFLIPGQPVRIQVSASGLQGLGPAPDQLLRDALTRRLAQEGIPAASEAAATFWIRTVKNPEDARPDYERQTIARLRGGGTTASPTDFRNALVVELESSGNILWRDTIRPVTLQNVSSAMKSADTPERRLETMARAFDELNLPYFIPESPQHPALPLVFH